MDAPNNVLLFHTDTRWLSSNVLERVFDLRNELKTFFNQRRRPKFEEFFSDKTKL